ncbi:MAG: PKD domain-containing protein [Bacteroidota bacterium]
MFAAYCQFPGPFYRHPTSWSWDFGNGNTSTLQNLCHLFVPGAYTITLTATNANGSNTLTRSQYITVYDIPAVNFSVDTKMVVSL